MLDNLTPLIIITSNVRVVNQHFRTDSCYMLCNEPIFQDRLFSTYRQLTNITEQIRELILWPSVL